MRRNNEVPSQRGSWTAWYCMYEFIQTYIPQVANPLFSSIWIMMGPPLNSVSASQGIQKCIFIGNEALVQIWLPRMGVCSFVTIYFPFSPPPVRDQTFVIFIFFCSCIQKCWDEMVIHIISVKGWFLNLLIILVWYWIYRFISGRSVLHILFLT